jgi:ribosomal 50S subunit-recycling heat shock protein
MRLDKFLKVSRILKRRTLATEAAKAGKVLVGGREVKPAYRLKVGDVVEIKFGTGAVKFVINELKETVKKEDASKMYTIIGEDNG